MFRNLKKPSKSKIFIKSFINLLMPISAIFLIHSLAYADGTDLLKGTSGDLVATIKGEGKLYLYLAEIAICTYTFIKTRNPMVFAGVIVLAVGFNVLFKIAGV